jgi:hypothetical protein
MKARSPLVHLLPNYDEYFIGLKDRSAMHNKLKSLGITSTLGALSGHILIIDGQIAGGWKQMLKPKSVVVKIKLLRELARRQLGAVESEIGRLGAFLGLPAEVDIAQPRN